MSRPLLLLLLSLLAVAHCRTLVSDPATDAETTTEVVPAEQDGFLRLPSHRRHHPCHHHRFHSRGDAALVRQDGERRRAQAEEEVKPVAEPDPDHSLPNSSDGGGDDGDDAAVKGWRKEVLWRVFRHGLRHHRHRHHHEDEDEDEEDHEHEQEEEGSTTGVKRFHRHHGRDEEEKVRKLFHHRHHDEDEEEERKPFHFHHHADDSDREDDELEEMVRRFRKALMRRRFHHARRFFRHHHHHHHGAEEAEEQAAGEQQHEGGGVVTWVKGLMNRF